MFVPITSITCVIFFEGLMKDFIIKTLYSIFDFCLPYRYATKAKIALVILFSGDWQFAPGGLPTERITSISSEELQEKLAGIGEENLAVAEQYIKMLHFFSVPIEFRNSYIYRLNGLLF